MMPPEYNKNGVTVRAATWLDAEQMAEHLRKSDKEEIRAGTGMVPGDGLRRSFAVSSMCYTIAHNGAPVVMFGVSSASRGNACIWMLATDGIEKIKQSVYVISKAYVNYFASQYANLYNFIDARNAKTRKWLELLGAKFSEYVLVGPKRSKFQYFEMKGI